MTKNQNDSSQPQRQLRDVMIDLETFGTGPDGAIVSIGACFFDADGHAADPDAYGPTFHEGVDVGATDPELLGDITPATVLWWLSQSPETIQPLRDKMAAGQPLGSVLQNFELWLAREATRMGVSVKRIRLWSNGPTFDEMILRSAFDRYRFPFPIHFRSSRCCRTMLDMATSAGWSKAELGVNEAKHDALADALYQARGVMLQRDYIMARMLPADCTLVPVGEGAGETLPMIFDEVDSAGNPPPIVDVIVVDPTNEEPIQ